MVGWPVPCLQTPQRFALRPGQLLPLSRLPSGPKATGGGLVSALRGEGGGGLRAGWGSRTQMSHRGEVQGAMEAADGRFQQCQLSPLCFPPGFDKPNIAQRFGGTKGPAWICSAGGRVFIWVHFSGAELCQAVCDSSDLPMIALKEMRHTK